MEVSGALVRPFYERFPYPHYPLIARPLVSDGLFLSARYWQRFFLDLGHCVSDNNNVLYAGCGDTQPYVAHHWQSTNQSLCFLDLSRKNVLRAKTRLFARGKGAFRGHRWHRVDLEDFANTSVTQFGHIDCFGVLHHCSDPETAVKAVAQLLAPGGTLRLMVYNSTARQPLHLIQDLLHDLGFSFQSSNGEAVARSLLTWFSRDESIARLFQFVNFSKMPGSRLADAYLHPQEHRVSLTTWLEYFANSDLIPAGIIDRYGELDDLPNPMWSMPTIEDLVGRVESGQFRQNFEFVLRKLGGTVSSLDIARYKNRFSLFLPPRMLMSGDDLESLPGFKKHRIWHALLKWISTGQQPALESLSRKTLLSLARRGLLLPGMCSAGDRLFASNTPVRRSLQKRSSETSVHELNPRKDLMRLKFNDSQLDLVAECLEHLQVLASRENQR